MELNKIYSFFFHPLSAEHSSLTQVLSTTTVIALSILTSGIFLVVFGFINLKNYQIYQIQEESSKISQIRSSKLYDSSSVIIPKTAPYADFRVNNNRASNPSHVDQNKINHLKLKHHEQIRLFKLWANQNNWKMFTPQYSHYDWWAFPINRSSVGQGEKYAVNEAEIELLKSDAEFMKDYRSGVQLVVQSWGWDLARKQPVQDKLASQIWSGYGVRLGKIADSLYVFGEKELYLNLQEFFRNVCQSKINQFPIESWVIENLFRSTSHM